jgi:hypothetical protein
MIEAKLLFQMKIYTVDFKVMVFLVKAVIYFGMFEYVGDSAFREVRDPIFLDLVSEQSRPERCDRTGHR